MSTSTSLQANKPVESGACVLLVGVQWDELLPALAHLRESPHLRVVGPVQVPFEGWVTALEPALVLVAPETTAATLAHVRGSFSPPPPILLCVPSAAIGTPDLYEGAEDFLVVPCSPGELSKRVNRMLLKGRAGQPRALLRVGMLALDPARYQVSVSGRPVELAWMEFKLLKVLMENPGTVFTREQLLARVWGAENFGGTRTVDVHIRRLRGKLGAEAERLFRTVRNVGYGMVEPP